jgi:hypothetical protein
MLVAVLALPALLRTIGSDLLETLVVAALVLQISF